ncbi:MAG: metallophosphoesterase [Cyclobacteriaceae bacterium]
MPEIKIQYCSDLHLEFPLNKEFIIENPLRPLGDILLLAGDIVPFDIIEEHNDFFDFISATFKTAYWLPGNHEYYHFNLADKEGSFCEQIRENVFLVNNYVARHDHVKFIFSTLWTRIGKLNERVIQRGMNDFYQIKYRDNRFTPADFNRIHKESKSFIQLELAKNNSEKTVVATHHVPTLINYPEKYRGTILNEAFAVEMFDTIEDSNVDYWIYGHHHINTPPFTIGKTELLTNQVGYVSHNEHKEFNNAAVFSV